MKKNKAKFKVGDHIKASSIGWDGDIFIGIIKSMEPVIIDLKQDNLSWPDYSPSDGNGWLKRYCVKLTKLERALK